MTEKLNDLIDEMVRIRDAKRDREEEIKVLNKQLANLQSRFIQSAKEAGTEYARGALGSATIVETVVPQIDDWDLVSEWIKENDALYLLHRRISSVAWKELRDMGEAIPGIEPFTKISVSLRKAND
jgi:cell division septum initiation protein DivIVA